jgi:hypothetical protein
MAITHPAFCGRTDGAAVDAADLSFNKRAPRICAIRVRNSEENILSPSYLQQETAHCGPSGKTYLLLNPSQLSSERLRKNAGTYY